MKASELRIGNIVRYGANNRVLDAELFLQLLKYTTPFEPIPLTEEWLLKFGFEFTNGYGFKIFGNWLQKEDDVYFYNVNGNFVQINYVHQLQNLYFVLTGEELKQQKQWQMKENQV
jgi:hypothetical protein